MTRFKDWVAALPEADDITAEDVGVVIQNGVSKQFSGSLLMNPLRGYYDISVVTTLPATGGRMADGTPKKGDKWKFSNGPGTIAGIEFDSGVFAEALIDTPGQTLANWTFYN